MILTHYIGNKIESTTNDIKRTIKKNEINYEFFLDNIHNYIYITDRLIFIRETSEYKFELIIDQVPTSKFNLKQENLLFDINVEFAKYNYTDDLLEIEYKIESDEEIHKITIEKE